MIGLGLEVEAFREMMGNSSLGRRVRVGEMCRDCESGILVILLMVDLRVVDILGVNFIPDMDKLIAIGLSVIGTLVGSSYPTRSWSWVRSHMHVVGCICAWNFGMKFFLSRGECKTRENSNFLKKGKIVILIKIQNFSRSRMMKRISLFNLSHEIQLPRRISLNSEVVEISRFSRRGCRMTHDKVRGGHMAPQENDTWH